MTRRPWERLELFLLDSLYPYVRTGDIAVLLGRTNCSVYVAAWGRGLRKTPEFLSAEAAGRIGRSTHRGRLTQFQPGQPAWNAGLTLPGWTRGRMAETQFRAGQRPHNALPVGAERRSKEGYLERKVAEPKRWRGVHAIVWEEAHGPVPAGHAVCFKDGDVDNRALDNLELVSRAELMARNTVHNLPKELALAIQLNGALKRKIRNIVRKRAGQGEAV